MDRREFIKKTAMATAAGVVMASPLGSVMAQENKNNTPKKMKVLLINGSARQNGNTNLALQEAAREKRHRYRTAADWQTGDAWLHSLQPLREYQPLRV